MTFLIYQDYVHNNAGLYKTLVHLYGPDKVRFCDAWDISQGILSRNITAFFMPGGASRYVSDKLDGVGNTAIKDYVSQGGLYIGICAGAYYACQRTEWSPDEGPSILVDNELSFFPGIAKGPLKAFAQGSQPAAIVTLRDKEDKQVPALYWSGPAFESEKPNQFEILATYKALDVPAIVSGTCYAGRYLLISPHLEIDSRQLALMQFDVIENRFSELAPLIDHNALTTDYFIRLMKKFIG